MPLDKFHKLSFVSLDGYLIHAQSTYSHECLYGYIRDQPAQSSPDTSHHFVISGGLQQTRVPQPPLVALAVTLRVVLKERCAIWDNRL